MDASRFAVGYLDGCFDLMHSGHLRIIRQAAARCHTLIVGIHSDAVIESYKLSLPVVREAERYALVQHIRGVDRILPDAPYEPTIELLDSLGAEVGFHGEDMPMQDGQSVYQELADANRLRILKRTEGVSTTHIISHLMKENQLCTPALASVRSLAAILNNDPSDPHPTVVYAQGSFDLLHAGHVQFLEDATKYGSWLLVGVTMERCTDAFTERIHKVASCKCVCDVIPVTHPVISEDFLRVWGINLVVRGSGHAGRAHAEAESDYRNVVGSDQFLHIPSKWPDLSSKLWDARIASGCTSYALRQYQKLQTESGTSC